MKLSRLFSRLVTLVATVSILATQSSPAIVLASQPPSDATLISDEVVTAQIPFIQNLGQVSKETVRFYVQTFGGTIFVEKGGRLTYKLPHEDGSSAVIQELLSSNTEAEPIGIDTSSTEVSYFLGDDPGNWMNSIPTYDVVAFNEICDGIDVSLKAYGNNIEKIFTVNPGAAPSDIQVSLEGTILLTVNEQGQLQCDTDLGPMTFTKPVAYQERDGVKEEVAIYYKLFDERSYGFQVEIYDPTLPLVIDPLIASTFIGGSESDASNAIAINDLTGEVYIAGYASSTNYPTYPDG